MYGTISVQADIRLCQPPEIQEILANLPRAPSAGGPNNDHRAPKSSPDHPPLPFSPQPDVDPVDPRHLRPPKESRP
jgi:hypothetical protein